MAVRFSLAVVAVAIAAVGVAVAATTATSRPLVQSKYGPVSGVTAGAVNEFKGIPYATPPVGELRWKAPLPPKAWSSPLDASQFGAACMQFNGTFIQDPKLAISEDCLTLNIYAPSYANETSKLPVLMQIHGGGWVEGTGSNFQFDGFNDVSTFQDVVLVFINYRLGVFGFLGSELLQKEDPEHSAGNYGIQDQRLAMQWVQQNIAAFGGDPQRVTIIGGSAGGGSICVHLLSKLSTGLFQAAMVQSGPVADWTAQPMSAASNKFEQVTALTKCNVSADVLGCLRAQPAQALLDMTVFVTSPGTSKMLWLPVMDEVQLTNDPRVLMERGEWASKVPVVLGTNLDEGTEFVSLPYTMNATGLADALSDIALGNATLAAEIGNMYPVSQYAGAHPNNTWWWTLTRVIGDAAMTCPARRMARSLAAAGVPVYLYYYTYVLAYMADHHPMLGCFHGSEMPMVYNTWPFLTATEKGLAYEFGKYWTSFSSSFNPNYAGGVTWPMYSRSGDENIVLDLPTTSASGLRSAQCDFWDAHQYSWAQIWHTAHAMK